MALEETTRPQDVSENHPKNKQVDTPVKDETDLAKPTNSQAATAFRPIMTLEGLPALSLVNSKLDTQPDFKEGDNKASAFLEWFPEPGDGKEGKLTKDDQGRVTAVEYPDGKKREFGYGEDGKLNKVVQPDGTTLVLKEGKWQFDSANQDGQKPAKGEQGSDGGIGKAIGGILNRDPDFLNPSVSEDGTFTFERKDGSKTNIYTDGSSIRDTKDGAKIFANSDEKVTSVKYANGDTRNFGYDDDGKLTSVTENGKRYEVKDGKLFDGDQETDRRNPRITPDGRFTYEDDKGNITTVNTDRTSTTSKADGGFVKKNADGKVTEVDYPDGKSQKFGYDESGNLSSITDKEGKTYQFKGQYVLGIRFGGFEAADGARMDGVSLQSDGTLSYTNKDGKRHTDFSTGNSTETTKTVDELRETAKQIHEKNNLFSDGQEVKDIIEGLSPADRVALDQQYKLEYGTSLTDTLKDENWFKQRNDNTNAALIALSDAHLRTENLKNFSDPEQLAAANKQLDDFQKRAKEQGVPLEKIADTQLKALEELQKGTDKGRDELLKNLEKTLTNTAPTIDSLNTKYGVKYDEQTLPNGSKVRHYYVEGEKGAKLPVLDSTSDNPVEVERQLKEWQDKKIKDLEQKYNVEFSKEGQRDNGSDLRAPRIDELLALEDGFKKSDASTSTKNGRPILVQFAVQPTSPYDAYVQERPDGQQRILFEPLNRDYRGLRDTIIHEWAHNAQGNLEATKPDEVNKVYEQMGYRKVKVKDNDGNDQDQWQFKDKDGNFWAQGPNQAPFGKWTRVDEQGRPLKADGTLASGWSDKNAARRTNQQMQDAAAVRPTTGYFPYPWENGAEAQIFFRSDVESRTQLYVNDPTGYEAAKKFDQLDLDNNPRYGKNADGSSKFIRLPDGTIAENNDANRRVVADFEATLPQKRQEAQRPQPPRSNNNDRNDRNTADRSKESGAPGKSTGGN